MHSLMTVGQSVRSTPMQWANEGKKLDCALKHVSWAPPWVQPRPRQGELELAPEVLASAPRCYIGENLMVEDDVGYGRIPAVWWTLNQRYNCDYELHRLNVKDRGVTLSALCSNDADARRTRFNFVRDAPDLAVWNHAFRAELHMRMVMPAVLGSSLVASRFETGPGGNPHFHGVGYGDGNPRLDNVEEGELEEVSAEASASLDGRAAATVRVVGEDNGEGGDGQLSGHSSSDGSGDDNCAGEEVKKPSLPEGSSHVAEDRGVGGASHQNGKRSLDEVTEEFLEVLSRQGL